MALGLAHGKWKEVSYSKNKNCFGISGQNRTTCRYVQVKKKKKIRIRIILWGVNGLRFQVIMAQSETKASRWVRVLKTSGLKNTLKLVVPLF